MAGDTRSPLADRIAGKRFVVEKNGIQSITLEPIGDQTRLTIQTPTGDQIFQLPARRWQKQSVYFEKLGVSAAAR